MLIVVIYYVIYFPIWMLMLRLGLLWAAIPNVTWRRTAAGTALSLFLPVLVLSCFFLQTNDFYLLVALALRSVLYVLLPWFVIAWLFKVRITKAIQAWLPTLIPMALVMTFTVLIVRPYYFEAFKTQANSMAPTLLGRHWQAVCSECGSKCYTTPQNERFKDRNRPFMICDQFHVTQPATHDDEIHHADRFLVGKFYEPRRWDLIAFDYPENPEEKRVARLVGLPGEEITIRNGQVYANGVALTPPGSLNGMKYLNDVGFNTLWGSPEKPAVLGADEYFVLGEFSLQSNDSRLWETGAPGHSPYAVPKANVIGVVINIYWPRSRWRAFR